MNRYRPVRTWSDENVWLISDTHTGRLVRNRHGRVWMAGPTVTFVRAYILEVRRAVGAKG